MRLAESSWVSEVDVIVLHVFGGVRCCAMYCTCTCIDVQCMYHESCATDCIWSWAISVTTPSVKVTTFPVHVKSSL